MWGHNPRQKEDYPHAGHGKNCEGKGHNPGQKADCPHAVHGNNGDSGAIAQGRMKIVLLLGTVIMAILGP